MKHALVKVDGLEYPIETQESYEELKKKLEERTLPIHQLGRENAIKVFEEWTKKSDKIEY